MTVAIPVRDGGPALAGVLDALSRQTVAHELLVCDSGSTDATAELARSHGARVLEIDRPSFSHGGTRNLLMEEAAGAHVALLTQDAEPAGERWLERLLSGFEVSEDVGIVYGSYIARPEAHAVVRWDLEGWFRSLSPDGRPRVDRLAPGERTLPAGGLIGRRGFFTDANSCISREAWSRVPFREVPYAEDRVLAIDMMRAGYAKVYMPEASVWHSHEYTSVEELERCFDESRGLREVYGWREPASPASIIRRVRGELARARRRSAEEGMSGPARSAALAAAARREGARLTGALLGSRADRLPPGLTRRLSLERRAGFAPLENEEPAALGSRSSRER